MGRQLGIASAAAVAVFALVFFLLIRRAPGYSPFDFPGRGFAEMDGLNAFDSFGGLPRRPRRMFDSDYMDYDRYYQPPPCPQYQSMRLSEWTRQPDGRLSLAVLLPGVRQENREAWLSEDGKRLHIRGIRPLSARGRQCLPQSARLSRDGRHELLEATVPLPSGAQPSRAELRQERQGLRVTVPLAPRRIEVPPELPPQHLGQQPSQRPDHGPTQQLPHGQQGPPGLQLERPAQNQAAPATSSPPARPTPPPAPKLNLPPSTGLVVEEEDYPEPAKRPDAASGWLDNRGKFHSY